MKKYEEVPRRCIQLGLIRREWIFEPRQATFEELSRVHHPDYLQKLEQMNLPGMMARRIGFPMTQVLLEREKYIAGGTIELAEKALHTGIAFNAAGGTHHASADAGDAYCVFNDMAVGAAHLLAKGLAGRILIVDLDVHQGDGTALIFKNEPRVYTFSVHAQSAYPLRKQQSDADLGFPRGTGGKEYLSAVKQVLDRIIADFSPDFIFYNAGVDVLQTDALGTLNLSQEDCRQRDLLVFRAAKAAGIPVVVTMGGGYSPELETIVQAHCNTFEAAASVYTERLS